MTATSPFLWRRRIGMRDVDALGVVWYGNYLVFCDEARAETLRHFGLAPGQVFESGFVAPVIHQETRYHQPARFDDEIDVHVRVAKARGTRLDFAFTIRRSADGDLLARVTTTLVLMRTSGDLVYLVPDLFSAAFKRMLAEQPEEDP